MNANIVIDPQANADDLVLLLAQQSPIFRHVSYETKQRAARDLVGLAQSMQRRGHTLTIQCERTSA